MKEVKIGKKEMAMIKDAALDFWKNNSYSVDIDGEAHKLENVAFIEGTICLLNTMGLLTSLPKLKYTERNTKPIDE